MVVWSHWFSWLPVFCRDGGGFVWLHPVWRRRDARGRWEYRLPIEITEEETDEDYEMQQW